MAELDIDRLKSLHGYVNITNLMVHPCSYDNLPDPEDFQEYIIGQARDYEWNPDYDCLMVYFEVENLLYGKPEAVDLYGSVLINTECVTDYVHNCPTDLVLVDMPKDCEAKAYVGLARMKFEGIDMYNLFRVNAGDGRVTLAEAFIQFFRPTVKKIPAAQWLTAESAGILLAEEQMVASAANQSDLNYMVRVKLPSSIPVQFLPQVQIRYATEAMTETTFFRDLQWVNNRRNTVFVDADIELQPEEKGAIRVEVYCFDYLVARFYFHTEEDLCGVWTKAEIAEAIADDEYGLPEDVDKQYRHFAAKRNS